MTFDRNAELTSVLWSPVFRRMIGYRDEQDFPNDISAFIEHLHPEDQEQEIFKKHTVDVTAEEVLELTVKTLKDILSENEITADIKLQKNEYVEE